MTDPPRLTEEELEKEIKDLIAQVHATLGRSVEPSSRLASVTGLSAVLHAYVSAHATATIDRTLRDVNDALLESAKAIGEVKQSVATVKQAADSFAESSEESERSMKFWTIVLTLFTLAQVVVAVLEYLKPR